MEHQPEEITSGQGFDLGLSVVCAGLSGYCVERAVNALETHIPEAGVAAGGIGFLALSFGGLAIYEWRLFCHGRNSAPANQPSD